MDMYSGIWALILAMIGVFVVLFIIVLVFYILKGFALYKMAQRQGIENAWLAFVPFGMDYIMGLLIGEVDVFGWFKIDARIGLPVGRVIGMFAAMVPVVGWLFPIAYCIYYFLALYRFYLSRKSESAVSYLVLSILFNMVAEGIIFFTLKDTEPSGSVIAKDENSN